MVKTMSRPLTRPRNFHYLLHPRPVILLMTKCPNEKINIAPFAWVTPVSDEPPTIAVAVDRSSYTFECLEHHPEATVNIPSTDHASLVYALGSTSGREGDKIMRFNVRLEGANKVSVPRWADAIGWLEVKVARSLDVGEVRLYLMEVLDYYGDATSVGEWGWQLHRVSPLHHGVGKSFYGVGRLHKASSR